MPPDDGHMLYDHDPVLLNKIADGDEAAFAALIRRYSRQVFIHSLTFIKNYESAEEAAQDIFVRIWNSREKLRTVDRFPDYLFIISRNYLISYLRKGLPSIADIERLTIPDDTPLPDRQLEYKQLTRLLEKGIRQLRPQQQTVYRLSREEGLTYKHIAEKLGLSTETVKWHLAGALQSLRVFVQENKDLLILLICWIGMI
jgi:RNA polymerase sigma-19 factor, ECF subfamily